MTPMTKQSEPPVGLGELKRQRDNYMHAASDWMAKATAAQEKLERAVEALQGLIDTTGDWNFPAKDRALAFLSSLSENPSG